MSVRIYQLSKELKMENKALIALLKKRNFKVDSASNTIPNIYADALIQELNHNGATKVYNKSKIEENSIIKVKSAEKVVKSKQIKIQSSEIKVPQNNILSEPLNSLSNKDEINQDLISKKNILNSKKPHLANFSKYLDIKQNEQKDSVSKIIISKLPIIVREFAILLNIKPFRLISELMEIGIFASMNQVIEEEIASKISKNHGYILEIHKRKEILPVVNQKINIQKKIIDEKKFLVARPPIVCVLGHVDHGKTTLLDTIRNSNVVSAEAGGITQHIGAYQIIHKNRKITFIDTPGHAAFSKMRERGANITDIAILVIAADDGFKPQTEEALLFAQKANVPIVVAINKIDAKGANLNNVYQQMQQKGITPEEWGGEILSTPISAIKNEKIDDLLELIFLQAEILEIKANPKSSTKGFVLESKIETGRGSTSTAIITEGTLKVGDILISNSSYCKVKAIEDDKGNRIKFALPSTPVNIIGWDKAPLSGSTFFSLKNEKKAKEIVENNNIEEKNIKNSNQDKDLHNGSIEDIFSAIAESKEKIYKIIIKSDVQGSLEAIKESLETIQSKKIKINLIYAEIGLINQNDIASASSADATIIGFNTKFDTGVLSKAKHFNSKIIRHNIIYELIDQVKNAMIDLLDPELKEHKLGVAQVRKIFNFAKGIIGGCMVIEGKIIKDKFCRIFRGDKKSIIFKGKISSIKRFKDDINEVRAGYECGILLNNFDDYQEGDLIECFEIKKIKTSL